MSFIELFSIMQKNIKECGILLINKDFDKMLIIFQNESHKWGLPKGYMESHEILNNAYFACAKRELLEETGIMINLHKYKKIGTVLLRDKLFYVLQLLRDIRIHKPLDKTEIGNIKWLPISNILNFLNNYSCNITLKEIRNYILTIYESHYNHANVQMA